jgi:hypothetical protein
MYAIHGSLADEFLTPCSMRWEFLSMSSGWDVSCCGLLQRKSQEATRIALGVRLQEIHLVVHQQGRQEPWGVDKARERPSYIRDYKCCGHEENFEEVWQGMALNWNTSSLNFDLLHEKTLLKFWFLIPQLTAILLQIHYSKQGQEFKAQAQSLHIEILQSPWLCELTAFYMNLRRSKKNNAAIELFSDCSLIFDDDRPTLTCNLFDSMRVDISLTCSICLVSRTSSLLSELLLGGHIITAAGERK